MTKVVRTPHEWIDLRQSFDPKSTLGFVPTMGALHEGHSSLAERSLRENEFTLVSLFVNPTQFNDPKDLKNYPRHEAEDIALLESLGVDYVLIPSGESMYPDGFTYRVQESSKSALMEGMHRPGHFDGMLTVVMKLLSLAGATRAYFGEKDYQQYLLVRGMAEAFFLRTEIVPCPTFRNERGLALSSRNALLSEPDRKRADLLNQALRNHASTDLARRELETAGFCVDYVEDYEGRRFVAARLGGVRLIDNISISEIKK